MTRKRIIFTVVSFIVLSIGTAYGLGKYVRESSIPNSIDHIYTVSPPGNTVSSSGDRTTTDESLVNKTPSTIKNQINEEPYQLEGKNHFSYPEDYFYDNKPKFPADTVMLYFPLPLTGKEKEEAESIAAEIHSRVIGVVAPYISDVYVLKTDTKTAQELISIIEFINSKYKLVHAMPDYYLPPDF